MIDGLPFAFCAPRIRYITDDEVRQQKATLLLEAHEAEQELANLAEKARRRGAYLKAFGHWLEQIADMPLYNSSFTPETYESGLGKVNVLMDGGFKAAMSFEESEKLF